MNGYYCDSTETIRRKRYPSVFADPESHFGCELIPDPTPLELRPPQSLGPHATDRSPSRYVWGFLLPSQRHNSATTVDTVPSRRNHHGTANREKWTDKSIQKIFVGLASPKNWDFETVLGTITQSLCIWFSTQLYYANASTRRTAVLWEIPIGCEFGVSC
jgi:hypothetical protein